MSLDTRNERHSALLPWFAWGQKPLADGSLANSQDRMHMAGCYAGFAPQGAYAGADASKRASILNYAFRGRVGPAPDGDLGNRADRIHLGWFYRGIVPASPTVNTTPSTVVEATAGVIQFTSSESPQGRTVINPPMRGQNGTYWRPSITTSGVVSLTDNAQVSAGEAFAAFLDDDGFLWPWEVDPCSQGEASKLVILSSTSHRVSVKCTFSTRRDTALPFRIYSIRPYLRLQNQDVPYRFEAHVEARLARPSVRVQHTGGPFVIDAIRPRLKPLKNQVKG